MTKNSLQVQLLITLGIISLFVFHEPTQRYAFENSWLLITAIVILFVTLIALACCEGVRRKSPLNYVILLLFTLAQSFMLGVISASFKIEEVFIAIGITAVITFSLTIFAFQTKWDFTTMGKHLIIKMECSQMMGEGHSRGSGKSSQEGGNKLSMTSFVNSPNLN